MSLLILSMVHLVRAGEGAPALVGQRAPALMLLCICAGEGTPALVCLYRGTSPGSRGRLYLRSGAVKA